MKNKYLSIECSETEIIITDNISQDVIKIAWEGINLQFDGTSICPAVVELSEHDNTVTMQRATDDFDIVTSIALDDESHWCTLQTTFHVKNNKQFPTPDFVCLAESDSLTFEAVGYKHQNAYTTVGDKNSTEQSGEEASGGRIPGCGYPVFSDNFFVGVEHVAAFTLTFGQGFVCKHYAVLNGHNAIIAPPVVIGTKNNFKKIKDSFLNYIDKISIPKEPSPFLCCCTFWSDPYLGKNEYKVNRAHYMGYINQFLEAGIQPDMLMLDAGWNDRESILQAKDAIGGDDGLKKLSDYLAEYNIEFGLWGSINGNMGISAEWAQNQGFPIGTGQGAAYSAPHKYIVLLDNSFSEKVADRYVELMEKTKCKLFKIDWDCECATNPEFNERYPTVNHVRTATIDKINDVHAKIIQKDATCRIRNGWWPSPWWLQHVTLTWLTDSGDCEYAALPSLTQRDRETTHRDAMYYYIFKESNTPLPLDSIDNHEMTKALRNPFAETRESWCNSVVMLFSRGTVYLSVMINAATLSDFEAAFLAEMKTFAEKYKHILFNKSARFIGGNPALGDVYGFLHQTKTEAIAVIRNPSITPVEYSLTELHDEIDFSARQTLVIYPFCANIRKNRISLLSHQTIMLYFSLTSSLLPEEVYALPFSISSDKMTHLAAGLEPDDSFGIIQADFAMIRDISAEIIGVDNSDNKKIFYFKVEVPDRMQDTMAVLEWQNPGLPDSDNVKIAVYHDRYPKTGDGHAIPVTTPYPKRKEGFGISRNSDYNADKKQYRVFAIPSGGEFFINLEIENYSLIEDSMPVIYFSGKRGRSRRGEKLPLPEIFDNIPLLYNTGIGQFVSVNLQES